MNLLSQFERIFNGTVESLADAPIDKMAIDPYLMDKLGKKGVLLRAAKQRLMCVYYTKAKAKGPQ